MLAARALKTSPYLTDNQLSRSSILGFFLLLNGGLFLFGSYHNVFNPDAYLYFQSAEVFWTQGLKASLSVYQWPFYSVLLAYLSKGCHISYDSAVLFINFCSYSALIVSFAKIFELLNAPKIVYSLGLLLLCCHPELHNFRSDGIRDIPYWACLIGSMLVLMQYMERPSLTKSILWQALLITGMLFRIEGIAMWVLLPYLALALHPINIPQKIKHIAVLQLGLIVSGITALIVGMIYPELVLNSRLAELPKWTRFFGNSLITYQEFTAGMLQLFGPLTSYPKYLAHLMTLIIFLGYFIHKMINTLGIIPLVFTYYGRKEYTEKRAHSKTDTHFRIILAYLSSALVIVTCFFARNYFLSGRFLIPIILCLLIIAAYGIQPLANKINTQNNKQLGTWLISLCFLYLTVDGLISFGASKQYYLDAGSWIQQHISKDESIYFNNTGVSYYANRLAPYQSKDSEQAQQEQILAHDDNHHQQPYQWLVVNIGHRDKTLDEQLATHFPRPKAVFQNKKQDRILIIKP